ncbi:AMP-binding protein, partial [Streptomyces albiflaviniger]|nr:AMP-binding protein [Streptomyces albiflaviniger]
AERPTPDAVFKRWTGWLGQKPTVFFGAPTGYAGMMVSPALPKRGDVALRLCSSAGEALPRELGERFAAHFGCEIIDGIGSTEMLHIFISAAGDDIRPGSTGRAVPGYRATILGPDGAELGPGEPGRLGVIGPVGCRYLGGERQRDYVLEGWNITGDIFHRDEDGYFHYHARSDNMIVSSGYNIRGP